MIFRSIRAQFAIYVSLASLIILALVVSISISVVKKQMLVNAQQNAIQFLTDYLMQIGVGAPDSDNQNRSISFRIFYLDERGQEASSAEVTKILNDHMGVLLDEKIDVNEILQNLNFADSTSHQDMVITESVDFQLIDESEIDIQTLQLSSDLLAMGQRVQIGKRFLTVGVSYPRALIDGRISEIITIFKILVPVFVLLSGLATWFVVGRVLKPVLLLTRGAERINERHINQRLEEPDTDNEFRILARTLNAMLDRIENAQKLQKQFISDASHELRSPLSATKLLLEISQRKPNEINWHNTVTALTRENERFVRLVDDLLLLARIDETGRGENHKDVDLEEILLEEARRPRVNIVLLDVVSPCRIKGNSFQISVIVGNLLDNADRYAHSRIQLRLCRFQGDALVIVEDDGPGVPANFREIIFERFSRAELSRVRGAASPSSQKISGAGLGLSIAKEIALQHKGTLSVKESALGGACFSLILPMKLDT